MRVIDTAAAITNTAVTDTAGFTDTAGVTETAVVTDATDISVSSVACSGSYRLYLLPNISYFHRYRHRCSSCCYRRSSGIVNTRPPCHPAWSFLRRTASSCCRLGSFLDLEEQLHQLLLDSRRSLDRWKAGLCRLPQRRSSGTHHCKGHPP